MSAKVVDSTAAKLMEVVAAAAAVKIVLVSSLLTIEPNHF